MLGWIADLRFEDLPVDVVERAKLLILDTLAVGWAAQDAAGMPAVLATVLAEHGSGPSSLWGRPERVAPSAAAFYNGSLASALDLDTLNEVGGVHADAVVVPAALAVAEELGAGGRDLITAYVAGVELVIRLGRATSSTTGWFRTATYGTFGAAVAAGKLAGFSSAQLRSALGIALGQTSGTQQGHIERKLTKRIQAGLSARAGVHSALLARHGITGPTQPFDGEFGLFALYDEGDASTAFADLGGRFLLVDTGVKKFPACACTHAAIQAALDLTQDHAIDPDRIEEVVVLITPYMNRLVGARYSELDTPEVTGQFCVQYAVAATLARRRFMIEDMGAAAVLDPALRPLLSRTIVRVDQISAGRMAPATVTVRLSDGALLARTVRAVPGGLGSPLTAEQIEAKVQSVLERSTRVPAGLVPRIKGMEWISSVGSMFQEPVRKEGERNRGL